MIRAEIRCCYNAGNLLGTVLVNEIGRVGETQWFRIGPTVEAVPLEWGEYSEGPGCEYRTALKSGDLPLELIRRIPGFIEGGRGLQ